MSDYISVTKLDFWLAVASAAVMAGIIVDTWHRDRTKMLERALVSCYKTTLETAAKAITPTYGTPGGPNAEQVDSKRDFYPYLGESSWDLLKRAAARIRALGASEPK